MNREHGAAPHGRAPKARSAVSLGYAIRRPAESGAVDTHASLPLDWRRCETGRRAGVAELTGAVVAPAHDVVVALSCARMSEAERNLGDVREPSDGSRNVAIRRRAGRHINPSQAGIDAHDVGNRVGRRRAPAPNRHWRRFSRVVHAGAPCPIGTTDQRLVPAADASPLAGTQ